MSDNEARPRSASPRRDDTKSKKSKAPSGFKWKEKRPRDESSNPRESDHLKRGYRDRSPRRDRGGDYRGDSLRDRERDAPPHDQRDDQRGTNSYRPPRRDVYGQSSHRSEERRPDGARRYNQDRPDERGRGDRASKVPEKAKEKKVPAPVSGEPMIIVNINDRLGTKAAIPCFASDSVKAFKAMVAAHIGRQPHEIMLKRQGERPFKDVLTLEDYGVSNGVQLDLELDTGD